jgi:4-hydroxyphenylpyruvate dioxygenase
LETGCRDRVTHVVKNGKVLIALSSPLNNNTVFSKEHSQHHEKHGDGVKDIAFAVEDCKKTFEVAKSRGVSVVKELQTIEDGKGGSVTTATIKTYGDTTITFIQRTNFKGFFLPGFIEKKEDPINNVFKLPSFGFIDHIVGNHAVGDMECTVQWFEKMLDFHRFWSIDDSIIHTEYR